MTAISALAWHDGIDLNGAPYPTRNNAPSVQGNSDDAYDLPSDLVDYARAIHEAGHAVAALIGGAHLHRAQIVKGPATTPEGGVTHACNLSDGHAYATFSAAGERAVDRWLHEDGLWTPDRAIATEVGAHGDRHSFLLINPHVGFGDKEIDYTVVHDLADNFLEQHWAAVTRVAHALTDRAHLTGDEIARIAGLPNRPRPSCTA
ncbi:hypothetical protein ACFVRD_41110 [Streptomyces sp. NPDC057908]|uniref:hypothetical protein n=1 Tax=Streptomyces sp. NPDC057908 TaxID=3346276 RepID=UPI0036E652F7